MRHTPYGYTIKDGKAIIEEGQSEQIKKLYKNYLLSFRHVAEKSCR